jgi:hypothetical protein
VLIQAFNPAPTGNFRLFGKMEIVHNDQSVSPDLEKKLGSVVQRGIQSRNVPWARWLAHDA